MSQAAKVSPAAVQTTGDGVIVFGRDNTGKAHASWFDEAEAAPARMAAAQMGYFALSVAGDGLVALSASLPPGRLFASGRAFVPFVKGGIFDQLAAHLPAGTKVPALRLVASDGAVEGKKEIKVGPTERYELPKDWNDIRPGTLVLATEGREWGWFECVVLAAKDNDIFELKWRDYPNFPSFYRDRRTLGLIFPQSKAQ